jgi:hypothetical protein
MYLLFANKTVIILRSVGWSQELEISTTETIAGTQSGIYQRSISQNLNETPCLSGSSISPLLSRNASAAISGVLVNDFLSKSGSFVD